MRKSLAAVLAICLCIFGCGFMVAEPLPISLGADAGILIDAGTGQVLCEKNADELHNASGAIKVMSMLLVFDAIEDGRLNLADTITVSPTAAAMGGTQAFLEANTDYPVEELVRAMCMASANDATMALCEKLYGSQEIMVAKMNERAQELGCTQTTFDNCTGLDTQGKTTARDLARIAQALAEKRNVFTYTSVYMYSLTHPTGRVTELANPNRLVRFYNNCDGFATGSSATAKYAGVFTAKQSDLRLIAVVLGASDATQRSDDAKTMLDYGFANYTSRVIARKGEILHKDAEVEGGQPKTVHIECAEDVRVTLERGEEKQLRKELELTLPLSAPVEKGQQVGTLHVYIGDRLILSVPAVTSSDAKTLKLSDIWKLIIRCWVCG